MAMTNDATTAWPTGTMPAMSFDGPSRMSWGVHPIPEPLAGHVLARVETLGVCGTDVHLFTGESAYVKTGLTVYPFRPGHEWCGTVVAVADDVELVSVGQRVVAEPFITCGVCRFCRKGLITMCTNRSEQGCRGPVPGAAAQYVRVPAANLAIVPDHVTSNHAVLAEPSVTVLNSLALSQLQPGSRVAVIGTGTLGLLAVQIASEAGALVDAIGIDDGMKLATAAGAVATYFPDDAPSDTYDLVLEVSGAAPSFGLALRLAIPGGHVSQAGIAGSLSTGVDSSLIVTKALTIHGALNGPHYIHRAVDLIARDIIKPAQLIERVYPWYEAEQAIHDLHRGGLPRPKLLLDFTELDEGSAREHGIG